jgi:chromosome partitioning protein
MRTIACLNWKGGSGKSTTALALAVGLARRLPKRRRVLLVDNDPQANSSLIMLEGRAPEAPTLADVLLDDAAAIDAIRPTRVDGLDILPADGRLAENGDCAWPFGPWRARTASASSTRRPSSRC